MADWVNGALQCKRDQKLHDHLSIGPIRIIPFLNPYAIEQQVLPVILIAMCICALLSIGLKKKLAPFLNFNGRSERIRTFGLLNPIQALYQTELHPDSEHVHYTVFPQAVQGISSGIYSVYEVNPFPSSKIS
jgi:hypothetical protein